MLIINNKYILTALTIVFFNILSTRSSFGLESFEARYKIYKGPITVGSIERSFELDKEGHYVFRSKMQSSGFVKFLSGTKLEETSRGKLLGNRIISESYLRETDQKEKNYTLSFDEKNTVVRRTDLKSGYEEKMLSNIYDKLNYQAQMMLDIENLSQGLVYKVATQKKIVEYTITFVGKKEISSPIGKFKTVIVNRKDPNSSKQTTVYCASKLDWLPVKIKHIDKKGKSMTAILNSLVTKNRREKN